MSTLQIRPRDPVKARKTRVTITLVNAAGEQVNGYTSDGELVRELRTFTSASGVLDVDITPNADVTPANTYYDVRLGSTSHLIEKGAGTETVQTALVSTPAALGTTATFDSLADVDVSAATDGQVAAYNATSEKWEPISTGGAAPVDSVNGETGVVVLEAADVGADPAGSAAAAQAASQPLDGDLTAIAAAGNGAVLAATTASFTTDDETKLDGVEAGADVTDATNVDAAGAVMNADTSTAAMSFVVDEDGMDSNSATKVPTQQSVKTYVDAVSGGLPIFADATARDAAIPSPTRFQTCIMEDTGLILVYYGATTGWAQEWGKPRGLVADPVSNASDQGTSSGTPDDLTDLSISFTAEADRWYLVALTISIRKLANNGSTHFYLHDGSTSERIGYELFGDVANEHTKNTTCFGYFSPSAGAKTWKAQFATSTVSVTTQGASRFPSQFSISDAGPASSTPPAS